MHTAENTFLVFYHLFVTHVPPMIAKHPMYLKGLQKDAFCNSGLPNLHSTAKTYKIHLWRSKWPSMLKFAGAQTRRRVRHSVLGLSCLQQHCDLYLSLLEYLSGRPPLQVVFHSRCALFRNSTARCSWLLAPCWLMLVSCRLKLTPRNKFRLTWFQIGPAECAERLNKPQHVPEEFIRNHVLIRTEFT